MVRFFVQPEELQESAPTLQGENAAHGRVLRLKPGERVLLCDGQGMESLCRVTGVEDRLIRLETEELRLCRTEARVKVTVYMAMAKGDKLEHVIQKATELGACRIVTFPSARCVSRPEEKNLKGKLERWRKIAASAAEQSGRGIIPRVEVLPGYAQAIAQAAQADKAILFYENERARTLRAALEQGSYTTVSLVTGPEGGLEEREVEQARQAGLEICTLGSRILRCETAPLCALSAVLYDAGEF